MRDSLTTENIITQFMSSPTNAPLAAAVGASPNLTLDEAGAIALGLFGLRASRVSSLGSCQDANFRIRIAVPPAAGTGTGSGIGADAASTDAGSGSKPRTVSFVLKVSNVAFAEPELDLQNVAMQHLSQRLHEQTQLVAPERAAAFAAALRVPRPLRRVRAVWPEEAESTAVANGIVPKSRCVFAGDGVAFWDAHWALAGFPLMLLECVKVCIDVFAHPIDRCTALSDAPSFTAFHIWCAV